ncbi:hypothetical protein [Aureimonas jatrophae]|uniref:Uncharacterized protein n=1 Tax=Aureimonas jatrophae TaxID=1166073 RepID=A0A1H0ENU2_9HYPH|nr:hypothetical protein [Aureimonas jatrophae]MBB3950400.1 hypothetical protein [Aureimonas jatrophae]SDN84074.1 hypothetical protein SAMN05192530_102136 [Aureimonas jatrophae]
MTARNRTLGSRVRALTDLFGAAAACAAAAEAGRRPSRDALKRVGIDADKYYGIQR